MGDITTIAYPRGSRVRVLNHNVWNHGFYDGEVLIVHRMRWVKDVRGAVPEYTCYRERDKDLEDPLTQFLDQSEIELLE